MKCQLRGFLMNFWISFSLALYFHSGEREEKCIIEDVPSDTLVIGNYKVQRWDIHKRDFLESAPGLGMFVTVTTPHADVNMFDECFCRIFDLTFFGSGRQHYFWGKDKSTVYQLVEYFDAESYKCLVTSIKVLLSKLYGPQGTFSFTSEISGEHVICLESNSTRFVALAGSKLRIHLDIRVGEHFLDEAAIQAKDKVDEINLRLEHLIEQIHHVSKEQNYEREREEKFRKTSEETNSNILWWAIVQTLILISIGIWQMKSLRDFFISKKLV